ncbi:MAG: site-specific integrase [Acetobacteraceae bacterium]
MSADQLPAEISSRLLTEAVFQRLADVPPEVEWFANPSNPSTRRAQENAVKDFVRFAGIGAPEELRIVTRAHIIRWRDEFVGRGLGGSTIRHRLSSLVSWFECLCEKNAVTRNPLTASHGSGLALSVKPSFDGRSRTVRKSWTGDGRPGSMIAVQESGPVGDATYWLRQGLHR